LRKLDPETAGRIRAALRELGRDLGAGTSRGGKSRKTLRGTADTFHRLRVGDYRVMYDVLPADAVILVLGVVNRGDLERWLRGR
jgi:mRNA-degrading endonuclease RelE of RelBE toxin-antitoxin system